MSRTDHKGKQERKGWGVDLWSRRPNSGARRNKTNRKQTIRRERAAEERLIRRELDESRSEDE